MLGVIYRVSQKLLKLFHDDSEQKITDAVFIEYPREGLWVPAYITNRMGEMVVVYIPTSPNPTSGFTIIVHESKVMSAPLTIEEISSFIISLGAEFPRAHEVVELIRGQRK